MIDIFRYGSMRIVFIFLQLFILVSVGFAQEKVSDYRITGKVVDEKGIAIKDASIFFKYATSNQSKSFELLSNKEGCFDFSFKGFRQGRVIVHKAGFVTVSSYFYFSEKQKEAHDSTYCLKKGVLKKIRVVSKETGEPIKNTYFNMDIKRKYSYEPLQKLKTNDKGVISLKLPSYHFGGRLWGEGYALAEFNSEISLLSEVVVSKEAIINIQLPDDKSSEESLAVFLSVPGSGMLLSFNTGSNFHTTQHTKLKNNRVVFSNVPCGHYLIQIRGTEHTFDSKPLALNVGENKIFKPAYTKLKKIRFKPGNVKLDVNKKTWFLFNVPQKNNFMKMGKNSNGVYESFYKSKRLYGSKDVYFFTGGYYPVKIKADFESKDLITSKLIPGEPLTITLLFEGKPKKLKGIIHCGYEKNGFVLSDVVEIRNESSSIDLRIPQEIDVFLNFESSEYFGEKVKISKTNFKEKNISIIIRKRENRSLDKRKIKCVFIDAKTKKPLRNRLIIFRKDYGRYRSRHPDVFTNKNGVASFDYYISKKEQKFIINVKSYVPLKISSKELTEGRTFALEKGSTVAIEIKTPIVLENFQFENKIWKNKGWMSESSEIILDEKDASFKLVLYGVPSINGEVKFSVLNAHRFSKVINIKDVEKQELSLAVSQKFCLLLEPSIPFPLIKSKAILNFPNSRNVYRKKLSGIVGNNLKVWLSTKEAQCKTFSLLVEGDSSGEVIAMPKFPLSKPMKVNLNKGNLLEMTVVDTKGNVLSDINISVDYGVNQNHVFLNGKTNSKGLGIFKGLPGGNLSINIRNSGYEKRSIKSYQIKEKHNKLKIILNKVRTIKIFIKNGVGDLPKKARVIANFNNRLGTLVRTIRSIDNYFLFEIAHSDIESFTLIADGYQMSELLFLKASSEGNQKISVSLKKAFELKIKLIDESDKTLTFGSIKVFKKNHFTDRHPFEIRNNRKSEFVFSSLGKGIWAIETKCKGYVPNKHIIEIDKKQKNALSIKLKKEFEFYGLLIDQKTKKPINVNQASLKISDAKSIYFSTERKGGFKIRQLKNLPKTFLLNVENYHKKKIDTAKLKTTKLFFDDKEIDAYVLELQALPKVTIKTNVKKGDEKNEDITVLLCKGKNIKTYYIHRQNPNEIKIWIEEKFLEYDKLSLMINGYLTSLPVFLKPFKDGDQIINITMSRGAELNGVVANLQGELIADVKVLMKSKQNAENKFYCRGISDTKGVFKITGLPNDQLGRLTFRKKGYKLKEFRDYKISANQKLVSFQLGKAFKIKIKPSVAKTKIPKWLRLRYYKVKDGNHRGGVRVYLQKNGFYETYVDELENKYFDVLLEGYRVSGQVKFLDKNQLEQEFVINFEKGLELKGNFIDRYGERISGTSIEIELIKKSDNKKIKFYSSRYQRDAFSFKSLEDGLVNLKATHDDYLTFKGVYDVKKLVGKTIEIKLEKSLLIHGQFIDLISNKPITGTYIRIIIDDNIRRDIYSDSKGRFTIRELKNYPKKILFKEDGYQDILIQNDYAKEGLKVKFLKN